MQWLSMLGRLVNRVSENNRNNLQKYRKENWPPRRGGQLRCIAAKLRKVLVTCKSSFTIHSFTSQNTLLHPSAKTTVVEH